MASLDIKQTHLLIPFSRLFSCETTATTFVGNGPLAAISPSKGVPEKVIGAEEQGGSWPH